MKAVFRGCFTLVVCLLAAAPADAVERAPLTVFAASSLTSVLQPLGAEYARHTGQPVRFSFGSSAALARQIEAGAGADVFISADRDWMNHLLQRGALRPGSVRLLAGNRLVLVAPVEAVPALKIGKGFALAKALGNGRLALADPDSVPAGRYAREALTALGVWQSVAKRLVRAEDVRHALNFVARGEAPLGIVYATDARVETRVRVVDFFPVDSHAAIVYPAALASNARPGSSALLAFLAGAEGRAAFATAGFGLREGTARP